MERRLLDATERLMSEGASFTELSVDRLSTEAGMSRASFYIYFEDKGHLLRRLAARCRRSRRRRERWWSVAWRHDPDDVRAAMAGIIASYRRHQPVLVALNEMAAYDPSVAATYRELLDRDLTASDAGHRRRPGRRLDPPRAAGGHHGRRADLDGRAVCHQNLPETARLRCRAGHHAGRDRLGCTVFEGRFGPRCDAAQYS